MATLTPEQEKAFLEKLISLHLLCGKGALKGWPCPFCGHYNCYQTRLMYALQSYEYDEEKKTLVSAEGPVLPVVPLICQNCGCTIFFNALISETLFESLGMK